MGTTRHGGFGAARAAIATVAVLAASVAGIAPSGAIAGFGDVAENDYFAESVQWLVDSDITTGTSVGCFSPFEITNRAQAAAFFHRAEGSPAGGGESFVDVGPGDWFHDAVSWMVNEGITTGTTPTTFDPYRPVTRGEMAALMHRAAGSPAAGSEPFSDVTAADFFQDAVAWMVDQGITTGTTPTTFDPDGELTRGEIATFLYRADGKPAVDLTGDGICDESGFGIQLAQAEARSLELLNSLRADLGLAPAVLVDEMDDFARDWSQTMDDEDDFRHSGGPYAENIAWWSAGWATPMAAAEQMHDMWVDSPGHYRNMTRAHHDQAGIGFWLSDDGWHATHVFS